MYWVSRDPDLLYSAVIFFDRSDQTASIARDLSPLTHLSPMNPFRCAPSNPSSSYQPVKERPCQHKTHTAVQDISSPQLAPRSLEVIALFAFCQYAPDEYRDEKGAEQVEEETEIRLKTEDAGGDTEERGGKGANV